MTITPLNQNNFNNFDIQNEIEDEEQGGGLIRRREEGDNVENVDLITNIKNICSDVIKNILIQSDLNGIYNMSLVSKNWCKYIKEDRNFLNEIENVLDIHLDNKNSFKLFVKSFRKEIIKLGISNWSQSRLFTKQVKNLFLTLNNAEINFRTILKLQEYVNSANMCTIFWSICERVRTGRQVIGENDEFYNLMVWDRDSFHDPDFDGDVYKRYYGFPVDFKSQIKEICDKDPNIFFNVKEIIHDTEDSELTSLPNELKLLLPSLKVIRISFPGFLNSIPFDFVNLTELILQSQKIKKLPKRISQLQKLELLDLKNNKIKKLPYSVGFLTNLHKLDLSDNKLMKVSKNINNLNKLSCLILDGNQIKVLPKNIGNLTSLDSLSLNNNKIVSLPNSLYQLTNLRTLSLKENNLFVISPDLNKLKNLTKLNVASNPNLINMPYWYDAENNDVPNVEGDAFLQKLLDCTTFSYRDDHQIQSNLTNLAEHLVELHHAKLKKDFKDEDDSSEESIKSISSSSSEERFFEKSSTSSSASSEECSVSSSEENSSVSSSSSSEESSSSSSEENSSESNEEGHSADEALSRSSSEGGSSSSNERSDG